MKRKYKPKVSKITKQQKLTGILGLFIISIMVLSALNFYDTSEKDNEYTYQGKKFIRTENNLWTTYLPNKQLTIISNPKDLENISINYIPLNILNSMQKIYLSINPKDRNQEALYELKRNIPLSPLVVTACYEDNELCTELPLKSCEDATDNIGVILLKESNLTKVEFKNNCLTIQGKELVKLVDKITLQQI
ncbi:hypothetical protein D6777_00420 [Candidatus Woesearchaeota archaeon]|nr:MAG: hypothetical protein D6777_00420 [Candidatus Woesearchaeota archaeon]